LVVSIIVHLIEIISYGAYYIVSGFLFGCASVVISKCKTQSNIARRIVVFIYEKNIKIEITCPKLYMDKYTPDL
jgi:hypothetical protein